MDSRKIVISVGIIAGITAIGYGLYTFILSQLKGAMNFCYKLSNIKFLELSQTLVSFNLELKFLQNSDFRIKIKNYNFDIFINGKKVANVNENKSLDVLPKAVSYITTNVSFSPKKLFNASYITDLLYKGAFDKKNFIVLVKGKVNASVNFIRLNMPIEIKTSLEEILAPAPKGEQDKSLVCKIY